MAAVVPDLNSLIKLIGLMDRVDSGLYVPETGVDYQCNALILGV